MNAAPALLAVDGVKKFFRRRTSLFFGGTEVTRAVDGVSLSLAPAEVLAVVGESGSGKSTLARLILGLVRPDAGAIQFESTDIATASRTALFGLRRHIQMVFQDPYSSLNPRKVVYTAIAQPLLVHHVVPKREVAERVFELLAMVGLTPPRVFAERHPHELSGGQRQRVALARALACGPRLVVADEPVASLDVSVRAQVLELIQHTHESLNVAYLFITHDLAVVRSIAHRVAVMYLGQIVESGPTEEVLKEPLHPYTRALLLSTPIANPRLARQRQRLAISGEIPSPAHPPAGCRFHPRCPFAMPVCSTTEPPLLSVSPGRLVACHLVTE
jgi:oligopeptide transport system ATP-binding protein